MKMTMDGVKYEGKPKELAEFMLLMLAEQARQQAEAVMTMKAEAEKKAKKHVTPSRGNYVKLKDGETVYVYSVNHRLMTANVAKAGDGSEQYKTVNFEDIAKLLTYNSDEVRIQIAKNREDDKI